MTRSKTFELTRKFLSFVTQLTSFEWVELIFAEAGLGVIRRLSPSDELLQKKPDEEEEKKGDFDYRKGWEEYIKTTTSEITGFTDFVDALAKKLAL